MASKAKTSSKNAPVTRSGRTPAVTAVMPLVPRAPWPSGISRPSGRKGKSDTSSKSRKAISTPPTTKEVGVQAGLPRSQTLKCSSSTLLHSSQSSRPQEDTREANVPTIYPESVLRLAKGCALGAYNVPFYLLCKNNAHPGRVQYNPVSCVQEDGTWTWKCENQVSNISISVRFWIMSVEYTLIIMTYRGRFVPPHSYCNTAGSILILILSHSRI
ncbi:hypothetical protein EDB83DRAFT_2598660 [Lactarius deliciosus]|nr:hypothetical protein EDB83DRAFT_2598660 [Lactarius deliciosus]